MPRKKNRGPEFWPAIDRELFFDGMHRSSRRTGKRTYSSLPAITRSGIEGEYGMSLQWLERNGLLDPQQRPTARWPPTTIEKMAVCMLDDNYAVSSIHSRVGRLKRALALMEPGVSLNYFDALLREFERPTAKFDPVVWKVTSADLQAFGIELMDNADVLGAAAGVPPGAYYCWGLQIALIAARPWRKGAFTNIDLQSNLVREGSLWRMRAHAHENKQKRYQSGLVPSKLIAYVDAFINIHRPTLCQLSGYTGDAMWLNKQGKPMTPQQFLKAFAKLTAAKFGIRVTIQAVRKIAAVTMATQNPSNVHHNQGILGHSRYSTGEQWYALAGAITAHADLDSTIDRLSRRSRKPRRKRLAE